MAGNGKDLPVSHDKSRFQGPLSDPKRELFAQKVASGMSPTEAHRACGYICKQKRQRASAASRLKRISEVHLRITALQAEMAATTVQAVAWGQAKVMEELQKNIDDAREGYPLLDREGNVAAHRPDYAAINRALELYGKQLGMFKETILTGNAEDRALEAMTDEEVQILQDAYDRIAELRRFAGAKSVGSGTVSAPEGEAEKLPAVPETASISQP
jgi:hypothetical protein